MSTEEAAEIMGVTEARARQLANTDTVRAEKICGRWLIPRSEAERIRNTPAATGRPRGASDTKPRQRRDSRKPARRNGRHRKQ